MSYENIQKPAWKGFFDSVSKSLEGQSADVQVIGVEVGDQVEGEWLKLDGVTYEPADDALYIYAKADVDRHFEHTIQSPQEVYADVGEHGIAQLVVIEASGRKQLVTLRDPLRLAAENPS